MEAKVLKTNGDEVVVTPVNGKDFSLKELQGFVGGYIEIIHVGNQIMVLNEEGKLQGLAYNDKATKIMVDNHYHDYAVGDVLVCNPSMIK